MNAPFQFWRRWLLLTDLLTAVFGLAMVLMPDLIESMFNALMFSASHTNEHFDPDSRRYLRFVYGVLGAVMVGWSTLMLIVVAGPFSRFEPWAWRAIAASLTTWFVVDSTWSISTGYWQNAVLNLVFALGYALPLAATRRAFNVP